MPGQLVANSYRKASLRLKILIVGGSIAGLATAYALQKAGHDVTVLERSDGRLRSRGGLRSPPNMTRILNQWGLGPILANSGQKCNQFVFQEGASGNLIGSIILHEQFIKDLVADFIFIQHGDLYSMLYDLACQEGAQIRFNTDVTAIDSHAISVTLASGEVLHSDVVVGADGPGSLVRSVVVGEHPEEKADRNLSLNFTIPTEAMREEEDLLPLTEKTDWSIWLGHEYMFHGSLIHGRREFSVTFCFPVEGDVSNFKDDWMNECQLEDFKLDLERFEPRVRKMLKLAKGVTANIHIQRPYLESSVCDRARVVLVGEAAHPLMPSGQHNTALVIEDAQTLGSLFSRIKNIDQVPRMLCAYEDLRQARCNSTQEWEHRKRGMLTLPEGPIQRERDSRLRYAMAYGEWDHMDEESFKEIWGDEIEMFNYDATEKVEDWWTKWGSFLERGRTNGIPAPPSIQVSVSQDALRGS